MLRRYTLLLLLPLFIPAAAAAAAAACPYDIPFVTRMIPPACYANSTTTSATSCCWYVFGAYIYAAVRHANSTGAVFLPPAIAAACSSSFSSFLIRSGLVRPSLILSQNSCNLSGDPVPFSAGHKPCQYSTVATVRRAVNISLAVDSCTTKSENLDDAYNCTNCQNAVIATVFSLLNTTASKEVVACGMAATIGIWAGDSPGMSKFESYVLCMVQILENVGGLGTGFLLPSPPPPPPPRAQSRTSSSPAAASSTSSRTIAIAAGSAGGAAVCAAAALCMALAIMRSRKSAAVVETVIDEGDDKKDLVITTETPEALPRDGLYIFTRTELKQATNSYEEKLLLGEGGAGKVYLGTLPSGQRVAIKRLYREKKLGEFYKEIEILAKLRHKNLTTLLGYCLSDHEHALVYEYMPGGNLAAALHHGDLSWRHRVKIAADVAEGLAYLHGLSEGPVVHRDVKPTNVLLGEGWAVAKLSDFGVSRVVNVDSGATHLTTEVRGTMGYVDPESFAVGHVSEATDVYSFGVVLLQLVTGMKAVVQTPSGGAESIVNTAYGAAATAAEGSVAAATMVDPRLGEGWDRASVEEVFRTGMRCVSQSKNLRPRMAEVLTVLRRVIADIEALEEPSAAAEDEGANTTTSGEIFSSDPTSSASDVPPPSIHVQSL